MKAFALPLALGGAAFAFMVWQEPSNLAAWVFAAVYTAAAIDLVLT